MLSQKMATPIKSISILKAYLIAIFINHYLCSPEGK
jgi:hypothetical protein